MRGGAGWGIVWILGVLGSVGTVAAQTITVPTTEPSRPAASIGNPAPETPRSQLGLILPTPYVRGKIPVVFVHGLWMNPSAWSDMIGKLRADSDLDARFQFWTFGYATGDPIPYAALLLRRALDDARRTHDPAHADAAFDQMVVVGHSMGGLLAKMQVVEPGERLWDVLSTHPTPEMKGEAGDRSFLTDALIFQPRTEIRRVVFIATPHRGSRADAGSINRLGVSLVRISEVPLGVHRRLIERNGPDFFAPYFTKGMPTSVEEMRTNGPLLSRLVDLPINPSVRAHSIIAVRSPVSASYPTDGLVGVDSARIPGVASETMVHCPHILCLENAEVLAELRRILRDHLAQGPLAVR